MAGLRERKRRRTFKAIHDAALQLFAERGYADVTVADIADAAEVSRATVFAYYPAKEDIVVGDARFAIESLEAALSNPDVPVVDAVREWLRSLIGWMEPEIVFQRRLAEEVPAVGAARARLRRDLEAVIGAALEREMSSGDALVPQLVAGALGSALMVVEEEAARRMASGEDALGAQDVDTLFDTAIAFIDGGLARIQT